MVKIGKYELTQIGDQVMMNCTDGQTTSMHIIDSDNIFDDAVERLNRFPEVSKCADLFLFTLDNPNHHLTESIVNNYNGIVLEHFDLSAKQLFRWHLDCFVHAYNQVYCLNIDVNDVAKELKGFKIEAF